MRRDVTDRRVVAGWSGVKDSSTIFLTSALEGALPVAVAQRLNLFNAVVTHWDRASLERPA